MTTPFTAGCETVRHALLNIMMQVSNMQITCCYLSVPWTASVVPSLDTLIHYCCPFIQQPARLVLLNISYWNSCGNRKQNPSCWLSSGSATLC